MYLLRLIDGIHTHPPLPPIGFRLCGCCRAGSRKGSSSLRISGSPLSRFVDSSRRCTRVRRGRTVAVVLSVLVYSFYASACPLEKIVRRSGSVMFCEPIVRLFSATYNGWKCTLTTQRKRAGKRIQLTNTGPWSAVARRSLRPNAVLTPLSNVLKN